MLKVFVALAGAVIVAATSASSTAAHAAFVTATPAPDSGLAAVPGQVSVVFTETVTRSGTSLTVIGPNGATISGPSSIADNTVVTALTAAGAGVYTVNWSNVSAIDGHENGGTFRFTVAAASAPAPQPVPAAPPAAATAPPRPAPAPALPTAATGPAQAAPRPATGGASAAPPVAALPVTGVGLVADTPLSPAVGGMALGLMALVPVLVVRSRRRHRRS